MTPYLLNIDRKFLVLTLKGCPCLCVDVLLIERQVLLEKSALGRRQQIRLIEFVACFSLGTLGCPDGLINSAAAFSAHGYRGPNMQSLQG
eukprot:scaffold320315_cov37-Tisochrysis_lutea.AAC.2